MALRHVAVVAVGLALTGCVASGAQPTKKASRTVPHTSSSDTPAIKAIGTQVSLPRAGFAVSRGNSVVLYTISGRRFHVLPHVRIANARFDRHPWLLDRKGRYLRLLGGKTAFRATRAPQRPIESDGKGCIITDASHHVSVKVCTLSGAGGNLRTRLTVVRSGGRLTLQRSPPGLPGGNWQYGVLSPNGQQLLAQWSGECEVPQPYLVDAHTGDIRPIGNSRSIDAPEGFALGWTQTGLPVVDFPTAGCGLGVKSAGVYLTSTSGQLGHHLIATTGRVVMWS